MSDTGWTEPHGDGWKVRDEVHAWRVWQTQEIPPLNGISAQRYYLNDVITDEDQWTASGYLTKDSDGMIVDGTPEPEANS
ncbi:hypothetical protein EV383_4345 [Pseudonocardia sediminis]|uniref:Uncharacterized protein n=1 Tax=Pseudonocardia sediminis TaxID=1397368 RepID=A0A4Q7UZ73_PSEST|nr:hypothetical protein [Pseudonocardia sediminis]RZT87422.1 hypothetical protein EV383_4345 [Pseudonocardia sediminis]